MQRIVNWKIFCCSKKSKNEQEKREERIRNSTVALSTLCGPWECVDEYGRQVTFWTIKIVGWLSPLFGGSCLSARWGWDLNRTIVVTATAKSVSLFSKIAFTSMCQIKKLNVWVVLWTSSQTKKKYLRKRGKKKLQAVNITSLCHSTNKLPLIAFFLTDQDYHLKDMKFENERISLTLRTIILQKEKRNKRTQILQGTSIFDWIFGVYHLHWNAYFFSSMHRESGSCEGYFVGSLSLGHSTRRVVDISHISLWEWSISLRLVFWKIW